MFTGIVEGRGEITGMEPQGGFIRIRISTEMDLSDVNPGDSVAVDGACLTATTVNIDGKAFTADVSPESLRVTTLGAMSPGSGINLEKALRLDSRLGGHLVLGHVDCVGRIVERRTSGVGYLIGFQVDSGRYLIEKGSVAIDGVSLTVNKVQGDRFWVMIIPHTASLTGVTVKKINDRVNIEYDMIGKYVEKLVSNSDQDKGIDEQKLKDYGFM
ncbi:riboflavin synthase [Thermodesulfobacteriota bacterium]